MKNIKLQYTLYSVLLLVFMLFIACEEKEVNPDDEEAGINVTANDFSTSVAENPAADASLGNVSASASDGSVLTYAITTQNVNGALLINANTGELTVGDAATFDFETNPSITATYTATADTVTSSAAINITLTDVEETTAQNGFVTTWRTTSANETIEIPVIDTLTYNYAVDWGDGSTSANLTANAEHIYSSAGIYTVTITGDFPAINFEQFGLDPFVGIPEQKQIASIEQWGNIQWETMRGAFFGCENLIYNASDVPDLSRVSDLSDMFYNAEDFDGAIGNWDVSTITNMEGMFLGADSFNQALNEWDVSNVTNMSFLFFSADNFNQALDQWDVSNVTTMQSMFLGTAFDQPIENWEVSNVTSMEAMFAANDAFNQPLEMWNVTSVTNMTGMFRDAEVFNQPLNEWDVGSVTDMREMFANAGAFNQNLNNWNVENVTDMKRMFVSTVAFDGDISTWNVSKVTDMEEMFRDAIAFNKPLNAWDTDLVVNCSSFALNSALASTNFPPLSNCSQ